MLSPFQDCPNKLRALRCIATARSRIERVDLYRQHARKLPLGYYKLQLFRSLQAECGFHNNAENLPACERAARRSSFRLPLRRFVEVGGLIVTRVVKVFV